MTIYFYLLIFKQKSIHVLFHLCIHRLILVRALTWIEPTTFSGGCFLLPTELQPGASSDFPGPRPQLFWPQQGFLSQEYCPQAESTDPYAQLAHIHRQQHRFRSFLSCLIPCAATPGLREKSAMSLLFPRKSVCKINLRAQKSQIPSQSNIPYRGLTVVPMKNAVTYLIKG